MRITGATARGGGASAASYLLFARGFCQELLRQGYRDGMQQREAIREFFAFDAESGHCPAGQRPPANETPYRSKAILAPR